MLLEEEMRRVIAYGRWKAAWWSQQGERRPGLDDALTEALRAYAAEHEYLENSLADKVEAKWHDVRARAQSVLAQLADGGAVTDLSPTVDIEVELDEDDDDNEYGAFSIHIHIILLIGKYCMHIV